MTTPLSGVQKARLAAVVETLDELGLRQKATDLRHVLALIDTPTGPRRPACPEGLEQALFTDNETGEIWLVNREGDALRLPPAAVSWLAVTLADHCDDNSERAFVADCWSPIDEEPADGD